MGGKLVEQRILRPEEPCNLLGEELEHQEGDHRHHSAIEQGLLVGLHHPAVVFPAVVESQDGLAAQGDADDAAEEHYDHLSHGPRPGDGDLAAIDRLGPIGTQHVHQEDLGSRHQHMVAEDGAAQGQDTLHRRGGGAEIPPAGVDHLQPPGQVAHRQEGGQDLPQHGGQGDALHPHIQPEEEDGVKDHVENGPGEQDRTGVPGAAVSPDHMGHGRGKDAEGHPQEEDEGIGPGVGHHGLGGPEEVEHGL